jgi:nucleoside-diphosphate kinase
VIIKPDAQERGLIGRIISRIEDKYLRITGAALLQKDDEWYGKMYPHLRLHGDMVYDDNKIFMLSAPLLGLVVVGEDAVYAVREIVAVIRHDFATLPCRYNCIHASTENAEQEISLFFGEQNA